jgi:hypothetical protein
MGQGKKLRLLLRRTADLKEELIEAGRPWRSAVAKCDNCGFSNVCSWPKTAVRPESSPCPQCGERCLTLSGVRVIHDASTAPVPGVSPS